MGSGANPKGEHEACTGVLHDLGNWVEVIQHARPGGPQHRQQRRRRDTSTRWPVVRKEGTPFTFLHEACLPTPGLEQFSDSYALTSRGSFYSYSTDRALSVWNPVKEKATRRQWLPVKAVGEPLHRTEK